MFHSTWCDTSLAGRRPGLITPSHSPRGSALSLLFNLHTNELEETLVGLLVTWADDTGLGRKLGQSCVGARIQKGPGGQGLLAGLILGLSPPSKQILDSS